MRFLPACVFLSMTASACLTDTASAAIIYDVVINQITYDNFYDGEADGYHSYAVVASSSLGDYPAFVADFSADHTLILRLSAPSGQRLVVNSPSSQTDYSFQVSGGTPIASYTPTLATWNFNGLSGTAPGVPAAGASMGELGTTPNNFNFHGALNGFGASFSFTSMDVVLNIPSGFTPSFNNPLLTGDMRFYNFSPSDQGTNWVGLQQIQAVPEPSSFALVAAVVGGAWWKRRRSTPSEKTAERTLASR